MRRRIANHAEHGTSCVVHGHALRFTHDGVHATHAFHPNKSVVVDVVDRKRDLIRVPRQHNARAAAGVERGDAVAVFVVGYFVGKFTDVIEPHPLPARFVAGGAGGVDEFFQKVE